MESTEKFKYTWPDKYFPIDCYSNWGYCTILGGVELLDGDKIEIIYPDGKHKETVIVKICTTSDSFYEQNQRIPTTIYNYSGYFIKDLFGAKSKIFFDEQKFKAKMITPVKNIKRVICSDPKYMVKGKMEVKASIKGNRTEKVNKKSDVKNNT